MDATRLCIVLLFTGDHSLNKHICTPDFVCRDQGLVKVGGVHVIITFYPEGEREYVQIKGRTCRQDNPG
jgi:hypothetical protein